MESLVDRLMDLEMELAPENARSYDVEYVEGVLTLRLGAGKGTYVINKQPPNQQIWLSSPLSGPKRFDYDPAEANWTSSKDQSKLLQLLSKELSQLLDKRDLKFDDSIAQ